MARALGLSGTRRARLRFLLFAVVAIGSTGLAVASYAGHLLRRSELETVDARFSIRGTQTPPPDIVVVKIDDVTFNELNLRWPFPRSVHARLIDRLTRYGARAIAYDVQFTEPTQPEQDNALIDAVGRSGRTVLSTTEVDEHGGTRILGGDETLRSVRARPGDTSLSLDPGGVVRRMAYAPHRLPTFGVVTAERAWGKRIAPSQLGGRTAPIDYRGPPGTFRSFSFSRVLRGRADPSDFRGKVVVVGATAPSLQDVHATSTTGDSLMSGAELQANAISTAHRGFPMQDSPGALDIALIALLSLMAPLGSLVLRPLLALGLALAAGVVYAVVAQLAFDGGTILPLLYPLGGLALSCSGALAVYYVTTAYERERVRDLFGRFVPDRVVDQVVAQTDDLRLGGVERDCTVLFSDIRAFTSYSESRPPGEVIDVLNRYHSEMCAAIMGNGGTLVSYIGDGILAVFGAPLPQEDHAERALAAAREMIGPRLAAFNGWLREEGHGEGFRMGIGLNSGPVLAGNIGSEKRLEYTAIGDTVNTASRLEGMTKESGRQVLAADSTRSRLNERPADLEEIGDLAVRGRESSVRVWGLREEPGERDGAGSDAGAGQPDPATAPS
ncbi:MAG: CHASE2 domain-containing protein [Thermoleophilaceae bacterium]